MTNSQISHDITDGGPVTTAKKTIFFVFSSTFSPSLSLTLSVTVVRIITVNFCNRLELDYSFSTLSGKSSVTNSFNIGSLIRRQISLQIRYIGSEQRLLVKKARIDDGRLSVLVRNAYRSLREVKRTTSSNSCWSYF
jgi:hypothetical protein